MKCTHCQTKFDGYRTSKYCSDTCSKTAKKEALLKKIVAAGMVKYPDGTNPNEYISCGVCGYRSADLAQHPSMHGLSQEEYRSQYGDIKSAATKAKVAGTNNPGYKHNGKLSPFSKNFVNYKDDATIDALKRKSVDTKATNNTNPLTLTYYTSKGFSQDDAKILLKSRQSTFSLQKCIDKYGVEEGTKVWGDRQQKWLKSFKRINYSKISQELFDSISEQYTGNVYYATYDRVEMMDYKNKELRLSLTSGKTVLPDFIDVDTRRIIEFDGDYWHSPKVANPTKTAERDRLIEESQYKVLHVKEFEYKSDKQKVIKECIDFLTA